MHSPLSYKFVITAAYALTSLDAVSARSLKTLFSRSEPGINCDGSALCVGHSGGLNQILYGVNGEEQGTVVKAGTLVASYVFSNKFDHGMCATIDTDFTIGPSTNGQDNNLADVVGDLMHHGCDPCGTAPLNRTGNDLSMGSLTVNYCTNPQLSDPTENPLD